MGFSWFLFDCSSWYEAGLHLLSKQLKNVCSYLSFWITKMDFVAGLCVPMIAILCLMQSCPGGQGSCRELKFQKIQFLVWCRTLWGRREGWIIRSFFACLQAFFFLLSSNFYFQDFVLSSLHLLEFPQSYNPCYFQQNICISHFPLPLILSILKCILTWISCPKHVIVKWFIWIIASLNYAEGYIERKIFNLCISSSKNVNIGICCKDWYVVEVQLVSALINVFLNLIDDWVLIS